MSVHHYRNAAVALSVLALALAATACGGAAAPPTPTKAPAPTQAPEKPAAAASAPVADKLFLTADVVQGTKNLASDQMAAKTCVVSSRYPRNAEILWRVRVVDPRTGQAMDDKELKSVEVRLADGKTVVAGKYGKHSEESFWTSVWLIPKDYPTGTANYTIVATANDGRTGEFKPFNVTPSLLTITDDVMPDVAPPPKKS